MKISSIELSPPIKFPTLKHWQEAGLYSECSLENNSHTRKEKRSFPFYPSLLLRQTSPSIQHIEVETNKCRKTSKIKTLKINKLGEKEIYIDRERERQREQKC